MSLASVQLCRCIITIAAAVLEQRPSLLIVDQSDIPFPVSQANLGISLLPPHRLQMPQHRQVTVHEAAHAVRHAARLFARQAARRDAAAGDALLEAGFGEFVDCALEVGFLLLRLHELLQVALVRGREALDVFLRDVDCVVACVHGCWSSGRGFGAGNVVVLWWLKLGWDYRL